MHCLLSQYYIYLRNSRMRRISKFSSSRSLTKNRRRTYLKRVNVIFRYFYEYSLRAMFFNSVLCTKTLQIIIGKFIFKLNFNLLIAKETAAFACLNQFRAFFCLANISCAVSHALITFTKTNFIAIAPFAGKLSLKRSILQTYDIIFQILFNYISIIKLNSIYNYFMILLTPSFKFY